VQFKEHLLAQAAEYRKLAADRATREKLPFPSM
jgi:hypothetical protein